MASIYKRKKYYWIKYSLPNKKIVRKSLKTTSETEAKRLLKIYDGKIEKFKRYYELQTNILTIDSTLPKAEESTKWITKRWKIFNYREKLSVIFSLFKGKCYYCNLDVIIPENRKYYKSSNRAVLDHKIPIVGGGSDSLDNIVLCCQECNMKKPDKDPEEFIKEVILSRNIHLD